MQIIKPKTKHIEQIRKLWNLEDRYHIYLDPTYYEESEEEVDPAFDKYVIEAIEARENILIALEDDYVIGFVTFEIGQADYPDTNIKTFGEILELYVLEEYRGKGVGRALLDEAEKEFNSKGIEWVKLQCSTYNKSALAFYEKIGFEDRQRLLFRRIK